jgi:hypothetical protein
VNTILQFAVPSPTRCKRTPRTKTFSNYPMHFQVIHHFPDSTPCDPVSLFSQDFNPSNMIAAQMDVAASQVLTRRFRNARIARKRVIAQTVNPERNIHTSPLSPAYSVWLETDIPPIRCNIEPVITNTRQAGSTTFSTGLIIALCSTSEFYSTARSYPTNTLETAGTSLWDCPPTVSHHSNAARRRHGLSFYSTTISRLTLGAGFNTIPYSILKVF